jgi:uncharacterized protein
VILFGSHARGEASPRSDVDVCLVFAPDCDADRVFEKKLEYAGRFDVDLSAFHQLPLCVRTRVLKEGPALFVGDEDRLYEVAIRAVRQWEDFRHIHQPYLDAVARG